MIALPNPGELDTSAAQEAIVPSADGDMIYILDEECSAPEHSLTADGAIAFAERLIALARRAPHPRPIRRPAGVDDRLRALDG